MVMSFPGTVHNSSLQCEQSRSVNTKPAGTLPQKKIYRKTGHTVHFLHFIYINH